MLGWCGGRWWLDLACNVEAAWQVGGVGGSGVLRAVLGQCGGWGVAWHAGVGTSEDDLRARGGGNGLQHSGQARQPRPPCWGGVLGWEQVEVAQVARVHKGMAMACNVEGQLILSHILYLA
ncbi:hypothetical protein EDB83DRAFT_2321661 [Lactarius deliciosus]|nr:hypothetical protein EDB83DRAFT_2321661 [Lactarius deliciosus]